MLDSRTVSLMLESQFGHSSGGGVKITFLGDSGVGKTNLISRYTGGGFDCDSSPTIGLDCVTRELETQLVEGGPMTKINVSLWDTAGQERFRSITRQLFQGTLAFVLVYDLTSEKSFASLDYWLQILRENCESKSFEVLVLGNKLDMAAKRKVDEQRGKEFARNGNFVFAEVSAKTGAGVSESVQALVASILKSKGQQIQAEILRMPEREKLRRGLPKFEVTVEKHTEPPAPAKSRCC